jgi:hypothetical protein
MAEPAQVIDWRTARDERRQREYRNELQRMGLPMRGMELEQSVLLKMETMQWDLAHWHEKARTAAFLNTRMLTLLRLSNERLRASELLLKHAEAEIERLRALL